MQTDGGKPMKKTAFAAIFLIFSLLITELIPPPPVQARVLGGAVGGAIVGGIIGGRRGARAGAVVGGIAGAASAQRKRDEAAYHQQQQMEMERQRLEEERLKLEQERLRLQQQSQ
jgi:uncharacterized protein YcfJ